MVAEEQSFTRAAAKLGTSQSSLSHTIRRLETRLGVRLLTRTTRSVAPTEAGERLLRALRPALDSIGARTRLAERTARTSRPARSASPPPNTRPSRCFGPCWRGCSPDYPDIHVELSIDSGLTDIVAERFDAGVRLGEALAKDMVAVRIGPDLRMAVVGSPAYLREQPAPQTPHDLAEHRCINLRMLSSGGLYAWELEKGGREVRVRVEGPLAFNNTQMIVRAAVAGFGLGFVMEDQVEAHLKDERLVRVLEDWCPTFPGYHLYYPSRREHSAAFALLVEALRRRG